MSFSGIQFKMRHRIMNKLEKVGAIGEENAVTIKEVELDFEELKWLTYFAGGFLSKIKKTKDQRYYI